MFEINAREISDVICVNSTFRGRTEGDIWRIDSNLISDRVLTDLNDVIIIHAESINKSDSEPTERIYGEDNESTETAAAVSTRARSATKTAVTHMNDVKGDSRDSS